MTSGRSIVLLASEGEVCLSYFLFEERLLDLIWFGEVDLRLFYDLRTGSVMRWIFLILTMLWYSSCLGKNIAWLRFTLWGFPSEAFLEWEGIELFCVGWYGSRVYLLYSVLFIMARWYHLGERYCELIG